MLFVILSCTAEEAFEPSAYDPSEFLPDEAAPVLEPVQVEAALAQVLGEWRGSTIQLAPQVAIEKYEEAMSYADASCPQNYQYEGNDYWNGSCQTEQDAYFDGYLFYNTEEQSDVLGDGGIYDSKSINGAAHINTSDDAVSYQWGGFANVISGTNIDGAQIDFMSAAGSFYFSEAELSLSMELQQYVASYFINGAQVNAYSLNGTTPIHHDFLSALSFEGVIFYSALFGYPCEQEPQGVLSIRDEHGRWYDVTFDVSEEWELQGECDGCGTLFQNEEYLGLLCLPELDWLSWEGRPW